jgi:hypothetical protein
MSNVPKFAYDDKSVVPVFAADERGQPYTGKGYGSIDNADWRGQFVSGLPHGTFEVVWGDRVLVCAEFNHGVRVDDWLPKGHKSYGP